MIRLLNTNLKNESFQCQYYRLNESLENAIRYNHRDVILYHGDSIAIARILDDISFTKKVLEDGFVNINEISDELSRYNNNTVLKWLFSKKIYPSVIGLIYNNE